MLDIMSFLATCPYENQQEVMNLISIAKTVVRILQILVPIALIIWGSIDLGKAVIAGKEEDIKKAQKPFIQRIIAAVIVFLIPWLVQFIMGYVSNGEWVECWNQASSRITGTSNDVKNTNTYSN